MNYSKKRSFLLLSKIVYTFIILLVYLLGKGLPLYMIDISAYIHRQLDAEALLVQTISGDIYRCSLFALGISPYMISSIFIYIAIAMKSSEAKKKISPSKMNRWKAILTLILAIVMAVVQVQELQFRVTGIELIFAKGIAAVEMVAGAMLIIFLIMRNQKWGIGGQSMLIFVNIVDGIILAVKGYRPEELTIPLIISLAVIVIMVFMENTEKRIPVQRISIHNIYADKNYLAIKFNPIGIMPAMFSMACFQLVQLVISVVGLFLPEMEIYLWLEENVALTQPVGIAVYVLILYCLAIGFSRIFINPGEITEQFLKSGDSLQDLHAGRDTKKYLSGVLFRISFLSATIMSICLAVPMLLQLIGEWDNAFMTLPSSIMMLTGVFCNLYREVLAVRDLEAYKPFI